MIGSEAMNGCATFWLNGEEHPLAATTLVMLLDEYGIDPRTRGLAIAINGAVIPRRSWPETVLTAGDEVEIVKPFNGG